VILQFRVNGIAQQAGSKRAFVPKGWTRPIITDTNKNLKTWQQLVADVAHHELLQRPVIERGQWRDGVRLGVVFYLPRPVSLPRRVVAHVKKPDLDKLIRSVQDALAGVLYRDDAQIVDLVARKRYAAESDVPHVDIRLEPSAGVETTLSLFEEEVDHDGRRLSEGTQTDASHRGAAAPATIAEPAGHGRPEDRRPRAGRARLRRHSGSAPGAEPRGG
jgi:Holliday junction resolvase RusA-like endonuclease